MRTAYLMGMRAGYFEKRSFQSIGTALIKLLTSLGARSTAARLGSWAGSGKALSAGAAKQYAESVAAKNTARAAALAKEKELMAALKPKQTQHLEALQQAFEALKGKPKGLPAADRLARYRRRLGLPVVPAAPAPMSIPNTPEAQARLARLGGTTVGAGLGVPAGLLGLAYGAQEPELPMPGQLSMPGSPIMPNFPIHSNQPPFMPPGPMPAGPMPMPFPPRMA